MDAIVHLTPVQQVAAGCAAAAVLATAIGSVFSMGRRGLGRPDDPPHAGLVVALFFGATSAVIHAILLTIKVAQAGMEIVYGYPWPRGQQPTTGAWGLCTLAALWGCTLVAALCTRQARLATCLFWQAVMLVIWTASLLPTVRPNGFGGFERTEALLLLTSALSITTALLTLPVAWSIRRRRAKAARSGLEDFEGGAIERLGPPGFSTSLAAIAAVTGLLSCAQLLIPLRLSGSDSAVQAAMIAACAGLLALSCSLLIESGVRTIGLADSVLGLGSLAIGSAFLLLIPRSVMPAGELYPVLFNGLIFGFTGAGALCGLLEFRHRQSGWADLPICQFLSRRAGRFLFYNGVVAFLMALMMAVWPRLPGIAAMDDSYGRVMAGVLANLCLLSLMAWSARSLRWLTLHGMALLAVASTAGFVAARVLPFASHVN